MMSTLKEIFNVSMRDIACPQRHYQSELDWIKAREFHVFPRKSDTWTILGGVIFLLLLITDLNNGEHLVDIFAWCAS
jgi:hypothetical protein